MILNSKWTDENKSEAAGLLFDRIMKGLDFPEKERRRSIWVRDLINPGCKDYFSIPLVLDLQCEVTALRKELEALVDHNWIDVGSVCADARTVLEKCK